ncbi:hypothetical protein JC794_14125 [Morganella morganii]|uniref:hypothetical protein n=1 Tax=Morganella morganii TaxID=582 RepID=UPI0013301FDE|nr:hypothetical protein [Morganella morganii]EKW8500791.1 hypothetical protein [Morganella morganii]QXO56662.1 hypothetical protein JC827_14120 [Morganella morganii]QXO75621.1 hypothetical protein JC794_14125 [Morganella morganii]HCQ8178186.1 hypothetical protein [Morganella morganii]
MKAQPDILKVTLYIHAQKQYDSSIKYNVSACRFSPETGLGFVVAEHQIELPAPNITKADLVNAEIDSLRDEQNKILANAQVKSSMIEDQIQALLCLEGEVISKDDEALPY